MSKLTRFEIWELRRVLGEALEDRPGGRVNREKELVNGETQKDGTETVPTFVYEDGAECEEA